MNGSTITRRTPAEPRILSGEELHAIDAYGRAANYLALGMLYLRDNPLLRDPLTIDHLKRGPIGHWGSTPGQNFIWVHLNRLIRDHAINRSTFSRSITGTPTSPVCSTGASRSRPSKSRTCQPASR